MHQKKKTWLAQWPAAAAGVLAATTLVVFSPAVRAQVWYGVQEVPLPAGCTEGYASSVNEAGDVAGYCNAAASAANPSGYVWRGGVIQSLGKLPKGNFSSAAFVHPVSGVVVGDGDSGSWRPQGIVRKGTLLVNVFPNNGGNTHAVRVDDAGRIYGYFIRRGNANWQGAMWTPDARKPDRYTETILGGAGMPYAFNASGQGAGYSLVGRQTAAFWNNTGTRAMQLLPIAAEAGSSIANGLNDNGDVVGSWHPAFASKPVLWRKALGFAAVELPLLNGDNYGAAVAINNAGDMLGYSAYGVPGTWNIGAPTLIVWQGGIPYAAQTLLDPATGAGWTLTSLAGLNNHGQIAANASRNGLARALLLTPIR